MSKKRSETAMRILARNAVWPILLLLALTPALVQSSGGYDLSWATIDGGGHTFSTSADGVFSLGGTMGQPDAGVMAGDSHTLVGGFWAADTVAPPSVEDGVVLVQDEANLPIAGAQVFRNHGLVGVTAADGRLTIPDLAPGDRLVARLRVHERPSPKGNHNQDATQDWAYRVYITSLDILGTGTTQPSIVNDPQQTQILTVKKDNTLIGFNIVASVEWDASAEYLEQFRQGMALASQYLYNASNGQMLFERVTIYDNNQHMAAADYQVRASNQEWPRAHVGGLLERSDLYVFLPRFFPGSSANTGNWTAPNGYRTHIHEFGHYGLYLYDSYLDPNREPEGHCTSPAIRTNTTPEINATLMDYQYNATQFAVRGVSGLWSSHCEHTYQVHKNNGQSDWETIVARYRDPTSPSRWTLKTPVHYGAVVPGPTSLAINAWSTVAVGSDANTGVCNPPPQYEVPGSQTHDVDVILRTSTRTIVQGKTDDRGRITVLGAANGDRVIFHAQNSNLLIGSVEVACPPAAATTARIGATPVILQPAPFTLRATVVPGALEHQAQLRVSASVDLPSAPLTVLTQHGSDTSMAVPLVYEGVYQSYVGTMTLLPDHPRSGNLLIRARDAQDLEVEITALFSLDTAVQDEDTIITSADGQAELYIPANTLSADGTVAVEASHLLFELPENLALLSGPYAAQAAAGLTLTGDATLTFRYVDLGNLSLFKPTTVQIHHWDGAQWTPLESTLSAQHQAASARIADFGVYALFSEKPDVVYLPLILSGS